MCSSIKQMMNIIFLGEEVPGSNPGTGASVGSVAFCRNELESWGNSEVLKPLGVIRDRDRALNPTTICFPYLQLNSVENMRTCVGDDIRILRRFWEIIVDFCILLP